MAVTDAYESVGNYRAVIDKDDDSEDMEINADLLAVSRYIDSITGRFFSVDAADVVRDFEAKDARHLWLTDAELSATPTSVVVDADYDGTPETAYTDYQLRPLNASDGPVAWPYTELYLPRWATHTWPYGALVRVTAKWGWPAVPDQIKRATIHLTAILRLETPRAKREVSSMGEILGTSPEARGIVADLISPFVKVTV